MLIVGKVKMLRHLSGVREQHFTTLIALVASLALAAVWVVPTKATGAQSDLVVTVADAGIQSFATSGLENTPTIQVENFDSRTGVSFTSPAGTFSGTGSIGNAGVYGGAGGAGKFPTASDIVLTMPTTSDYRYVGFWWSAGNTNNHVDLLDINNNVLATFTVDLAGSTEDLQGVVGSCGGASSANNYNNNGYCGNPNLTIGGTTYTTRQVPTEQYAFVHLRYSPASGEGFRKVRFRGTGFEFDNLTISQTVPPLASTETTTETFVTYTISTPAVLIADPRSSSVSFPGVTLGAGTGETNAMLCLSQVTQSGGAIPGSAVISASGSGSGITVTSSTNLFAFSGARDTVVSFAPSIDFQSVPSGQEFGLGSIYIRVVATPQTNLGSAGCTGDAAVSALVEIRFLNVLRSDSVAITID